MSGVFDNESSSRRAIRDTTSSTDELSREVAEELAYYANHAYDNEDQFLEGETIIEDHSIAYNDLQVGVFEKPDANRLVVGFRGTDGITDVLTDLDSFSNRLSVFFPWITPDTDLQVHDGFVKSLSRAYKRLKEDVLSKLGGKELWVTGHSYGGALATIFAYVFSLDPEGVRPSQVYVFGSPRVFLSSDDLNTRFSSVVPGLVRIQNQKDIVTSLPHKGSWSELWNVTRNAGFFFGSIIGAAVGFMSGGYAHVGIGVIIYEKLGEQLLHNKDVVHLENKRYFVTEPGDDTMRDLNDTSLSFSAHSMSLYMDNVKVLPQVIVREVTHRFSLEHATRSAPYHQLFPNTKPAALLQYIDSAPAAVSVHPLAHLRPIGFYYYEDSTDIGKLVVY